MNFQGELLGKGLWSSFACFVYLRVLRGSSILQFVNHNGHAGTQREECYLISFR